MKRTIFSFNNYDNLGAGYSAKLEVAGLVNFQYEGELEELPNKISQVIQNYIQQNPRHDFEENEEITKAIEKQVNGIKVENIVFASVSRDVVKNQIGPDNERIYEPATQNGLDILHMDKNLIESGYTKLLPTKEGLRCPVVFNYSKSDLESLGNNLYEDEGEAEM